MRIGISLSEPSGPEALSELRDEIARAADDGFASAWKSNILGLDALTALAVAGHQVPDIELGTAVVPTYPRHPAALAQQARTTALALDDRLTLGIGPSHKIMIENMFGYDFDRPVRHVSEYLSILLPLLDGQPVAFAGETLRADLALSIPNRRRVPVVLAALGPQMLKLAGERTDGTVLWMTGPKTIREHIVPTIASAAEAAGRPAPRVVCVLPICVTSDPDAARAGAAKIFKIYGELPSYRAMMDREGAAGPADLAIIGDEDAARAQVKSLAEAGVTDFVAGDFSRGDDSARTRAFLKSLLS
ncbi:LLM class F420-dependent oxidoreductase [Actinomadura sp. HBU206391]|uniref:LLM class F420-dependent oxidoreductase n=1 Tax=Actinomadura sp. HBU206391 TaxID=2731692 RepID=UPI0016504919|nr:LLM class F420-dependent oxidoreductase [Actinomadura sp. HBU206391]MBC6459158.1 LLM class F420-dependent oxidoreductase [Actinomadura sp. HBU206391]